MTIKQAHQYLVKSIDPLYENREVKSIADCVLEDLTGINRSGMIVHQDQELNEELKIKLEQYVKELQHGRPLQYVLSKAWFMGMPFFVDERVLIPRPETEELVGLVKSVYKHSAEINEKMLLADIGTGSGCIAIALKKYFNSFEIWGIDNSNGALEVATKNANNLDTIIHFEKNDILEEFDDEGLPVFDIIVSNPPYVPMKDKKEMDAVVLNHEPHNALFVKNEDPLEFYNGILSFANRHLKRGGMIFFETHSEFSNGVASLMEEFEFENIEVKKDMYGKDRMVFGKKSGASL